MSPTEFLLAHSKLEYTPDYFFATHTVSTADTWGIVVWERLKPWISAFSRALDRANLTTASLGMKARLLAREAHRTGLALWVWDGLAAAPGIGTAQDLRVWALNQLNVLREIDQLGARWGEKRDKLSISFCDGELLNLARPLFDVELSGSAFISWQADLFAAKWQRWSEAKSIAQEIGIKDEPNLGLIIRANNEQSYYAELIRFTWETLHNIVSDHPHAIEKRIPWPPEPEGVMDNRAARRALDCIPRWCDAWDATPLTAVEKALMLMHRDPNKSLRQVAREVPCNHALLSRDRRIQRMREAQTRRVPKGSKAKDGTLEAEADE
jgi:hypothetical protein